MNKSYFLILLILVSVFSCKEETNAIRTTGKVNNISVIIDDQLWNGEIGIV
jgi:hypothetical protein